MELKSEVSISALQNKLAEKQKLYERYIGSHLLNLDTLPTINQMKHEIRLLKRTIQFKKMDRAMRNKNVVAWVSALLKG